MVANPPIDIGPCQTWKRRLAGPGLVRPEAEAEAALDRAAQWHSSLKPCNAYEVWLLELMGAEAIRLETCQHHDRALRTLAATMRDAYEALEPKLEAALAASSPRARRSGQS